MSPRGSPIEFGHKISNIHSPLNEPNDDNLDKKGSKRKRKERKPWRAPTAYEIFCEQERPKLKKQWPEKCSREINKELGTIWSKYTKQEKKKFNKEAKADKKSIAEELKAIEDRIGRKLKKPVCAYSLFVKD